MIEYAHPEEAAGKQQFASGDVMHLDMKAECERCRGALNALDEAYICSYECTFCPACASAMHGVCTNCGGDLARRPRRNQLQAQSAPRQLWISSIGNWQIWALSFGSWLGIALASGAASYYMDIAFGRRMPWSRELVPPLVNCAIYALLTPPIFSLSTRYPLQRRNWRRRALFYVAGGVAFLLLHVAARGMIYPVWDVRAGNYVWAAWNPHTGVWSFQWFLFKTLLLYDSLDDILSAYIPVVLIAHAVVYYQQSRQRESQAAQLETQLAKSRLQALKSQLQPHFLFNTMHSISSLMLTDVSAADKMMTRLSDLLRMSLENDGIQITTLNRELEFVNGYLAIEKIRFEDRLNVVLDVSPDAFDAEVPHLILQPLVENAVKHGVSRRCEGGEIRISASHDERDLYLRVRDNGPGLMESAPAQANAGVGLRATRERLRTLYGDQQSIDLVTGPNQGVEVRVRIPFRTEARPL